MAEALSEKNQGKQKDETIHIDELIKRVEGFAELLKKDPSQARFKRYESEILHLQAALDAIQKLTLEQVGNVLLEPEMPSTQALERCKSFVGQGLVLYLAEEHAKDTTTVFGSVSSFAKTRSDYSYFSRNLLRCIFFKDAADPAYQKDSTNVTLANISENVMLLSLAKLGMARTIETKCFAEFADVHNRALKLIASTNRFNTMLSIPILAEGNTLPAAIDAVLGRVLHDYFKHKHPSKMGSPQADDIEALEKKPLLDLITAVVFQLYKHTKPNVLTLEMEHSILFGLLHLMDNVLKLQGETRKVAIIGSEMRVVLKQHIKDESVAKLTDAGFAYIIAGVAESIVKSQEEKVAQEKPFKVTANELLQAMAKLSKIITKPSPALEAASESIQTSAPSDSLAL